MPNEWNRFADALFDAGAKVGTGVIIGGIRNDAEKTYKTALRNIDNIIKMSPSGQETAPPVDVEQPREGEMLNQFFDGFNPNAELKDNISTMQPMNVDQTAPLIKPRVNNTPVNNQGEDMLKVFLDASAKLGTFGEYGQPYQDPLSAYYKSKIPEAPKVKTEISNGYLVRYDDQGNILNKTKIDDLPKQEKNTVQKYSKMTLEEAEQLTDNELSGDAFFYLPKETQTALMQKYPALQQMHDAKFKEGDFAPKITGPGSKRFSAPKLNFEDKTVESIGEQLYKVRKEIEGTGWENADPKTIEAHDKLVQQLKGYGVDDWVSFSEGLGKGEKVKNLKEDQQNFKQDLNDIIYTKNGIYDMLITLWNLDSSNEQGAKEIQRQADALYAWLGNNIYQKVDYPMEKAIYDYVNSEISKLWNSKFGGK